MRRSCGMRLINPLHSGCSFSITPENIRKPKRAVMG